MPHALLHALLAGGVDTLDSDDDLSDDLRCAATFIS